MRSSTTSLRRLAAAAAALTPAALSLWSRFAWSAVLPDAIGSHWSGNGPADRTTPSDELFAATFAVSASAALIGAVAALLPRLHPLTRRLILLTTGSVSAIAATQWLVSTWLTIEAGDPLQPVLGAWTLVIIAAFAYGVIPLLLAPPPRPARTSP
ncbi:hypothetical protein ABCS02_05210 [Microbacterium sp. X-17]|uniref:hypothetical protein n=1 Tax=Microbacterium sp. X-17 TaxID=3144404 RepID=UPI0031F5A89D